MRHDECKDQTHFYPNAAPGEVMQDFLSYPFLVEKFGSEGVNAAGPVSRRTYIAQASDNTLVIAHGDRATTQWKIIITYKAEKDGTTAYWRMENGKGGQPRSIMPVFDGIWTYQLLLHFWFGPQGSRY